MIEDIIDYRNLEYHRSVSERQRNSYNRMRTDLEALKSSILIEIDFKQKIVLGT